MSKSKILTDKWRIICLPLNVTIDFTESTIKACIILCIKEMNIIFITFSEWVAYTTYLFLWWYVTENIYL